MNHQEIIKALNLFFKPGDVFEIRALGATTPGYRREHIESGYFDYEHINAVPKSLENINARGIYFTPNPVNPVLLARAANRMKPAGKDETTSDKDIICRRWLLIDCDSVRPSGISATDEEHDAALYKAIEIKDGFKSIGWPEPVFQDSGNGGQLMYRIDLPADDNGLVQACLNAISAAGDDKVKIDLAVFNPARIWRLPGTMNCKGDETDDRKYRMAKFMGIPDNLETVSEEKLKKLAGNLPKKETPPTPITDTFDLDNWINKYCPEAEGPQFWKDGRKWIFPICPFNPEHTNRSAVITQQSNGAIGFKCHHNGCTGKDWKALRKLREPEKTPVTLAEADLSGIMKQVGSCELNNSHAGQQSPALSALPVNDGKKDNIIIKPLTQLIDNFQGLNPPVVYGLLREGETMNIIASPKAGKSWLAISLAISVASGLDWLEFSVEQGRVMHLDNELFENTLTDRYQKVAAAMKIKSRLFSDNIDTVTMRGKLRDIISLGEIFRSIEPGKYKLVILDAFYRTLPKGTDENDNGAIASIYNLIDSYAAYLQCAFVLIHHSSKGTQAAKAVTDVGAGAGSQSRAVDTHLIIRPHEEYGIFVMEPAIRSWAPIKPMPIKWQWPLFTRESEADASNLLDLSKPKTKDPAPSLDEFVESCVAVNDPCSERSAIYEARQRYGISERLAKEMLSLAMERKLVVSINVGTSMRYVKPRGGIAGDKGLHAAALMAHNRNASNAEIAGQADVTERYVQDIRHKIN